MRLARSFTNALKFSSTTNATTGLQFTDPHNIGTDYGEAFVKDLKEKKQTLLYGKEGRTLYILEDKDVSNKTVFSLADKITKTAKSLKETDVTVDFSEEIAGKLGVGSHQFGLAFNLANYAFEVKSNTEKADFKLQKINFHGSQSDTLTKSKEFCFYEKMGRSKNYARDLANGRADVTTPLFFLETAKQLKKDHPKIEIKYFVGSELLTQGMNLHHAVGKASANEPVFINLTWMNNPSSQSVHGLVGKGLTFDCGGLHVKTYGFMEDMYMDKSGASAVLATFKHLVETGAQVNITCSLALAENAIGPNAYRPSDIIKSHNGLTVEVKNTDAEGRLVLADAMSWTQRNTANLTDLIELSTLTGACVVALGDRTSGLFSNDDGLANSISQAGSTVQEGFWRIPVFEEQQEATKGVHSDLVSIGAGRFGGHIFAAAFLEKFVEKGVKWAHLDIAGPAMASKPFSVYSTGCTGFGVGTLLELHKKAVINSN